jgi:hypothetical protein
VATGDWDPAAATAPGSSTGRGSWDPDPPATPGSSAGRGPWDPDPPIVPGSSAGHGSRDPDLSVEELSSSCGTCASDRSVISTMLTASEVAAM